MRKFLIAIVALIAAGALAERYGKGGNLAEIATPAVAPRADYVALKSFNGVKDGAIFYGTFGIENKGATDIKDVEITCTHFGPSGTAIDANTRTIYEVVKAKSTKTVKAFNMGFVHSQAVRSSCSVVRYAGG